MASDQRKARVTRRQFIARSAALGAGVTAVAHGEASQTGAAPEAIGWQHTADVVVVGAGASGLCAAIMARDGGASVIVVEQNDDIGGRAMLSGGRIPLGGGTSLQKKYGVADSADQVYADHTAPANVGLRYSDRDLVRIWADENAPTMEFLLQNGVRFQDQPPTVVNGGTVPRLFRSIRSSDDLSDTINGQPGSGLVRPLAASAKAKGVTFLLRHRLSRIVRAGPTSGRVEGIVATAGSRAVRIQARQGVVIATGGHAADVEFRRTFDPRLTEEYHVVGAPWAENRADGEKLAMAIGAAIGATGNQTSERGSAIEKARHIGCRFGYSTLQWKPDSPVFARAGASGLTVTDFQNLILVNQVGLRFWNELDDSTAFLNACLGPNGNSGREGPTSNGGGPIWAIFDAEAVAREKWEPRPPNVDPNGWFFAADTLAELARRIVNPFQRRALPPAALEQTVAAYNASVDAGRDAAFSRPNPRFKIQTPPFFAAWSTPMVHDSLSGLRINRRCQVIDREGAVIPGLYCAGESAGGFALHGLPRVTVFGRIAGREAALAKG